MDVAGVLTGIDDCLGDVGFFDVHVEEVGEEDDVNELVVLDVFSPFGEAVDEVRLVSVEGLVDEGDAVFCGGGTGCFEGVGEP